MNKPNPRSFSVGIVFFLLGLYLFFNHSFNSLEVPLGTLSLGVFFIYNSFRGKKVSEILNKNQNDYEINAPENRNTRLVDISRYMQIIVLLFCLALGLLVNFIFPSVGFYNALIYPYGFALILWGIYSIIKKEILLSNSAPAVWLKGTSAIIAGLFLIAVGFIVLTMLGFFTQIFGR